MEESTSPQDVVIDASIAVAEILPDEKPENFVDMYFDLFAKGKLNLVAPVLLQYEVANAMRSSILQKRTTLKDAMQMLEKFLNLPIIYLDINFGLVLELATKKNISVYDAAYLYIAEIYNLKLLTLDKELASLSI